MITAWRIVKTGLAGDAFDGEGARLYGGRWNSPGRRAVYTAGSLSLAALELLVHLQASRLLSAYSAIAVEIAPRLVEQVEVASLPRRWLAYPAPPELQRIGDRWLQSASSPVLRVPSAVIPQESNYLLNPDHPAFSRIAIGAAEPFAFDPRLG